MLYNYACVVPAGMIVFFPSYSFLNTAKDIWAKNKTLDRFGTKKKVCACPNQLQSRYPAANVLPLSLA